MNRLDSSVRRAKLILFLLRLIACAIGRFPLDASNIRVSFIPTRRAVCFVCALRIKLHTHWFIAALIAICMPCIDNQTYSQHTVYCSLRIKALQKQIIVQVRRSSWKLGELKRASSSFTINRTSIKCATFVATRCNFIFR